MVQFQLVIQYKNADCKYPLSIKSNKLLREDANEYEAELANKLEKIIYQYINRAKEKTPGITMDKQYIGDENISEE